MMADYDCFTPMYEFFQEDFEKTLKWFNVSNPLLGNVTPMSMIELGREEKLFLFIKTYLEGNLP